MAMIDPTADLAASCACVASFLVGRPILRLNEGRQTHDFSAVWLTARQLCVWDAERTSYVHVGPIGTAWQLFDVATGRTLRIDRLGQQFTFTEDGVPQWFEQVSVAPDEVHTSGPDGERCFALNCNSGGGHLLVAH